MFTPFRIESAQNLQTRGLESADITSINEIGLFLDNVERLGTGMTFSDMMHTLGRSREMCTRYRSVIRRLETPQETPQ
jgi:hypothetical protein